MRIEWTDREVVFIADVGTVGPGTVFDIEDSRGQDLVTRGAARLIAPEPDPPQERTMEETQPAHHITVTLMDSIGVREGS